MDERREGRAVLWRVAAYCRLSREDGYTSTNFDRPDFQRMMGISKGDISPASLSRTYPVSGVIT